MITIGDIDIYLFNDASNWLDPGGAFGLVPRRSWSRYLPPDDRNLVPFAYHNLLIRAAGKNIIVDTGYGNCLDAAGRARLRMTQHDGTHAGLGALGISADDIDFVVNTHLHDDHCTGNFRLTESGRRRPAFPNAEYLVQRREYQDAIAPNERTRATYLAPNFLPLFESGQMRLLDGDSEIVPGLQAVVTPGHTPAHMSLRIESRGQHAAFLCDLATMAIHFERLAWMTAYDVEPLVTLETKRLWQRWALETDALLIFAHDTIKKAGRLRQTEKGFLTVEPLDWPYDNP